MNRMSLSLFAVYLVLYGGFVFLNAYAPSAMEMTLLGGVNVAVLYGFGLIIAAFVLALLYGWLSVEPAQVTGPHERGPTGQASPRGPAAHTEDQP